MPASSYLYSSAKSTLVVNLLKLAAGFKHSYCRNCCDNDNDDRWDCSGLFSAYDCGDPASKDVMRIESNKTQGFLTSPPLMLLHFRVV